MASAPAFPDISAAIRTALSEGRLDDARAALDTASRRWPGAIGPLLIQGDILVAEGKPAAAMAHYRDLQQRHPGNYWVPMRLVRLLFHENRLAEARAVFTESVWPSAARDEDKSALVNALSHRHGDLDETARFLETLFAGHEHQPVLLARLASIRQRQDRLDEALELFDRAAALAPLPAYAQSLYVELLANSGRAETALPIVRELAAAHPHRVDHTERLIMVLAALGRHREAAVSLKHAIEKWPGDWRLLYRFNRMKPEPPVTEEIFAIVHARWPGELKEDRVRFQYALACLGRQMTDEARGVLRPIRPDGPVGHMTGALVRALDRFSPAEWCVRSRLLDDPTAEVQVVESAGADTAIFVFSGIGGGFAYLPFAHADAVFAGYRASVVYLRDYSGLAYFDGIASLAPTREETLRRLRDLAARLGAARIVMLGASVGGFAATSYAAGLKAHAAISFGGPSTLEPEFQLTAGLNPGDRANRMKRALAARVSETKDLVSDIAGAPETRFFQYYAADYRAEAEHAERFLGLPNVTLRPISGVGDHFVALHAIAGDQLDRLLVDDLGIARAGEWP